MNVLPERGFPTEGTLIREIAIAARPEVVWSLLTEPELTRTWWGIAVSFDLRVGGVFRVEVTPRSIAAGAFVAIEPPRRLVYTWGWEVGGGVGSVLAPGSTTVEIALEPDGAGTILRLEHRGLGSAEVVAGHGDGWTHYLGRLATRAAGDDPGPDPWAA